MEKYFGSSIKTALAFCVFFEIDSTYIESEEWEFLSTTSALVPKLMAELYNPAHDAEFRRTIAAMLVESTACAYYESPGTTDLAAIEALLRRDPEIYFAISDYWEEFIHVKVNKNL